MFSKVSRTAFSFKRRIIFRGHTLTIFNGGWVLSNRFSGVVRVLDLFAD